MMHLICECKSLLPTKQSSRKGKSHSPSTWEFSASNTKEKGNNRKSSINAPTQISPSLQQAPLVPSPNYSSLINDRLI